MNVFGLRGILYIVLGEGNGKFCLAFDDRRVCFVVLTSLINEFYFVAADDVAMMKQQTQMTAAGAAPDLSKAFAAEVDNLALVSFYCFEQLYFIKLF